MLAGQLDAGNFSRGLWYFLVVVAGAGVFAGIAGLGIGFVIGWAWEQLHRRRRGKRLKSGTTRNGMTDASGMNAGAGNPKRPQLRLVQMQKAPGNHVVGSQLVAVRFLANAIQFDFSGVVIETEGHALVSTGSVQYRFPEDGSRDALCRLIGTTVCRMRVGESNDLQLTLDDGSELALSARVPPRLPGIAPQINR